MKHTDENGIEFQLEFEPIDYGNGVMVAWGFSLDGKPLLRDRVVFSPDEEFPLTVESVASTLMLASEAISNQAATINHDDVIVAQEYESKLAAVEKIRSERMRELAEKAQRGWADYQGKIGATDLGMEILERSRE